jgi:hypothetical protein
MHMKTLSIRDLRNRPGEIRRLLAREGQFLLQSNGRPVALLFGVDEDNLDETVSVLRRARALRALESAQRRSKASGRDRIPLSEINRIVTSVRRGAGRPRRD